MRILVKEVLISLILIMIYLNKRSKNKKENYLHNAVIILFANIIAIIFSITGISPMSGFHMDIRVDEIQYIPFLGIVKMIQSGLNTHTIINIIGNIVMFLPVGFLIPLISKELDNFRKTVLIGFKISLLIEFTQLFLTRATDIDDLVLNTIGTILGYFAFIIFKKLFPIFKERIILQKIDIEDKKIILNCILIPYVVIIIGGFYERFML